MSRVGVCVSVEAGGTVAAITVGESSAGRVPANTVAVGPGVSVVASEPLPPQATRSTSANAIKTRAGVKHFMLRVKTRDIGLPDDAF